MVCKELNKIILNKSLFMVMDIREYEIRDMNMGCYQWQTRTVFLNVESTFIGNIRMAYNRKTAWI